MNGRTLIRVIVIALGIAVIAGVCACAVIDETAAKDAGPADATDAGGGDVDAGGDQGCTGRRCGDTLADATRCFGPCDTAAEECTGGPDWACAPVADRCAGAVKCGDPGTDGAPCPGDGTCADSTLACDPVTFECTVDPCRDRSCGETVGDRLCFGSCPDALQECKVDPAAPSTVTCVPCNPIGAQDGAQCADQGACKCGNDCVKLFLDETACAAGDPAACQKSGMCLEDCFASGTCTDDTQVCACSRGGADGTCSAGDCFATGSVKGNFSGKVLDSCSDQPAPEDLGQGNMTATIPGRSAAFDLFVACHYTGIEDLVLVQGMKVCGTKTCPDVLVLAARTADLKIGTMQYVDGGLICEWDEYTFSGDAVSDVWVRGLGIDGSVTFSQVGTAGKAAIAGTADMKLIKYDYQSCGGDAGVSCN